MPLFAVIVWIMAMKAVLILCLVAVVMTYNPPHYEPALKRPKNPINIVYETNGYDQPPDWKPKDYTKAKQSCGWPTKEYPCDHDTG